MATKIPSVLSYERKVSPSDGYLYGTVWEERKTRKAQPLHLREKAVRGTISNRMTKTTDLDPEKLKKKMENANPQQIDACFLPLDCDTLLLKYSVKFLSGIEEPSACNDASFDEAYKSLIKTYIDEYGFKELARRYATNIANARTLWRNRVGAENIEVIVKAGEKTWSFDAYDFSLRDFDNSGIVSELADMIAASLAGPASYLLVEVEIYAKLGGGQEVFPSEEMVFNKSKDDKSKILYETDGIAAMHSQKIGNAIRTIDTWYPDYRTQKGVGPIAAEVYGSVTNRGRAFRAKAGTDFYSIFDKAVKEGSFQNDNDAHYAIAVLLRGGLFGGKE